MLIVVVNGSWSLPRSGEKFRNHEEAVGQSAEMGDAQSGRNKDYWTAGVNGGNGQLGKSLERYPSDLLRSQRKGGLEDVLAYCLVCVRVR